MNSVAVLQGKALTETPTSSTQYLNKVLPKVPFDKANKGVASTQLLSHIKWVLCASPGTKHGRPHNSRVSPES